MKRPNKYRNQPVVVDGIRFASTGEARRYAELRLMERAGKIHVLARQVVFRLPKIDPKGIKYIADFVYFEDSGPHVIEDYKGVMTEAFRVKWAWMQQEYPDYDYRIVRAGRARRAAA
jgi:hypothetical protein